MTIANSTLDDQRQAVLEAMLAEAAFDGWTTTALEQAYAGLDPDLKAANAVLFPRGVTDVLDFWAQSLDAQMLSTWESLDTAPEKIRDKITWLVRQRIELLEPNREAARRAAATLALPTHAGLGSTLAWRTVGEIWLAIGDKSLDVNFYTKRASLIAVYLSTLAHWFGDETEGSAASWAFLDDRIGNVMQFEKLKFDLRKKVPAAEEIIGGLAKFRYGQVFGQK